MSLKSFKPYTKSRIKTTNRGSKKIAGYKKAIVTIKKGQNIDLTTGI